MSSSTIGSASAPTLPRALGAVALVLALAAITGALTPYASVHLPSSINSAANASGPWAMVAFASVYWSRARGLFAALLGACSFVVMNLVFFVAFEHRLGSYSLDAIVFWIGIALLIGPIVGLCASWLRSSTTALREIAVAAPGSVLVGEGLFMTIRQPGLDIVYSTLSIILGIVVFLLLAAWKLRRAQHIAVSVLIAASATIAFYASYAVFPLLFGRSAP